ncbi:MAG: hypothetical protein R6U26_02395 [Candidatus Undinarchaeales archaeon]
MKIKSGRIKLEEKDIKKILFRISAHMDIWTPQHNGEIDERERILGDDDIKEITGLFYKNYKRTIKDNNWSKRKFKKKFFSALKNLLSAKKEELRLRLFKVPVLIYSENKLKDLIQKYDIKQEL